MRPLYCGTLLSMEFCSKPTFNARRSSLTFKSRERTLHLANAGTGLNPIPPSYCLFQQLFSSPIIPQAPKVSYTPNGLPLFGADPWHIPMGTRYILTTISEELTGFLCSALRVSAHRPSRILHPTRKAQQRGHCMRLTIFLFLHKNSTYRKKSLSKAAAGCHLMSTRASTEPRVMGRVLEVCHVAACQMEHIRGETLAQSLKVTGRYFFFWAKTQDFRSM